jgi:hypothetical protein
MSQAWELKNGEAGGAQLLFNGEPVDRVQEVVITSSLEKIATVFFDKVVSDDDNFSLEWTGPEDDAKYEYSCTGPGKDQTVLKKNGLRVEGIKRIILSLNASNKLHARIEFADGGIETMCVGF